MVVALILGSGGLVPPSEQRGAGVLARGYAFVVVGLRYLIVGAWAAGVVLAILFLPPLLVPALVALFGRLGMWPGNRRLPPAPAGTPDGAAVRAASGGQVHGSRP